MVGKSTLQIIHINKDYVTMIAKLFDYHGFEHCIKIYLEYIAWSDECRRRQEHVLFIVVDSSYKSYITMHYLEN